MLAVTDLGQMWSSGGERLSSPLLTFEISQSQRCTFMRSKSCFRSHQIFFALSSIYTWGCSPDVCVSMKHTIIKLQSGWDNARNVRTRALGWPGKTWTLTSAHTKLVLFKRPTEMYFICFSKELLLFWAGGHIQLVLVLILPTGNCLYFGEQILL